MIDLEVWIPPGYDLLNSEDTYLVKEFGDIGPPGRFGWFIPSQLDGPVARYYGNWDSNIKEVHWTFLRDDKIASLLDVDEHMSIIYANAKIDGKFVCSESFCKKGIYTPKQCENTRCALLLTSKLATTKFVIDHINELKLYVRVVWLGENLRRTVETLTKLYQNTVKSLLILYYTPSELILREKNFISVIFPQCDYLNANHSLGCKYEAHRIVKMSWNKVEALGLLQPVRNFKFGEQDYEHLLTLYEQAKNQSDLRQIACDWIKDQNNSSWMMIQGFQGAMVNDKVTIYIGGIFPISESTYNGPGVVQGAVLAQNLINQDPNILTDYQLHLVVENGRCRTDSVVKIFIQYITDFYYNSLLGVLGPACSDTVDPLAVVSKHYRTMVISYSAEGTSFSDRDKYPYFFRTIGENKDYQYVYLQLFKKLGWKRVAALTEDGQKYTEYISHMQEMLGENDITFIANTKFPRERDTFQMSRVSFFLY